MANPKNLLKGDEKHKFTPEEHSKGGKASAKARRARKTLKEELLLLLEDGDTQKNVAVALINEASGRTDARSVRGAFEAIRDTIGEAPVQKVMVAEVEQEVIDEVEKAVMEDEK